jgi:GNAT superfamily N-acetyltransferase
MTIPTITRDRDPAAVRRILEALPDWFGDPDAIENYFVAAHDEAFDSFLAVEDGATAAVALVRRHFPECAELQLIAVDPISRNKGMGRMLVDHIGRELAESGCRYLTVHTVAASYDNEAYAQTREFYRRVGFVSLEEHENLDWPGPTVILVRSLTSAP